jgi:hypothetical protein
LQSLNEEFINRQVLFSQRFHFVAISSYLKIEQELGSGHTSSITGPTMYPLSYQLSYEYDTRELQSAVERVRKWGIVCRAIPATVLITSFESSTPGGPMFPNWCHIPHLPSLRLREFCPFPMLRRALHLCWRQEITVRNNDNNIMMILSCSSSRRAIHLSLARSRAAAADSLRLGRRSVLGASPVIATNGYSTPSRTRSLNNDATSRRTFIFNDNGCQHVHRFSSIVTTKSQRQHGGNTVLSTPRYTGNHQECQQYHHNSHHLHQQRALFSTSAQVFVSRHNHSFHRTLEEILDFLDRQGISTVGHRTTATHIILKECPFAPNPRTARRIIATSYTFKRRVEPFFVTAVARVDLGLI